MLIFIALRLIHSCNLYCVIFKLEKDTYEPKGNKAEKSCAPHILSNMFEANAPSVQSIQYAFTFYNFSSTDRKKKNPTNEPPGARLTSQGV